MDSLFPGFATLAVLTSFAALTSVAVASRLYGESRSECGLAAGVIFVTLIHAPIHLLGWTSTLDALNLGVASSLLFLAVLSASLIARPGGVRSIARACIGLLRLPVDAVKEAWAARSVALLGIVACGGIALWTVWLSWLAPSSSWDGLWYHEPMVGWAIQNHGFELVAAPADFHWVNGYPRTCENLMLWTTIFADRRLIEVWPSIMAPVAMLGFFVIAKRYTGWRVGLMGLGAVLFLLPATVLQLRSTYVDVIVLAAYIAALHFVTRPDFRSREIWMAALATAFLCGAKATGMFYGGMLGLIVLARVSSLVFRRRSGWPLLHMVAATALLLALAAPSYVRNVIEHDNPIWPLRFEAAGVVWEGPSDLQDMQKSFGAVVHELFGPPEPGQDYHDTRKHAYGQAVPYVALPLGLIALCFAFWRLGAAILSRRREEAATLASLLFVVAMGMITLATSPAYYWARYSLPAVAALLLLVAWFLGQKSRMLFGAGATGAMIVLSCITLYWADPGWDVTVGEAFDLAAMRPEERVGTKPSYSVFPGEASFAREREIGPGDLVVFADRVAFVGNLWNERMSNRVGWIPYRDRAQYLDDLWESGAEWAIVRVPTASESALRSAPDRWERLFQATNHNDVYRRIEPGSLPEDRGVPARPERRTPTELRPRPPSIDPNRERDPRLPGL